VGKGRRIARLKLDKEHPIVAYIHEAHARLLAQGSASEKAQAIDEATEAVRILSERFGPDHPLTADALGAQAEVEWAAGHLDKARAVLESRAGVEAGNFTRQLILSDELGYRALLGNQSPTDLYVSFHWNAEPNDASAARLAFEATLQRKGTLQDVLAEQARLQHTIGDGAELFARWLQAERTVRYCGLGRSPRSIALGAIGPALECKKDVLSLTVDAGLAYKALTERVPALMLSQLGLAISPRSCKL